MTFCNVTPIRMGSVAVPGFMAGAVNQRRIELGVWAFLVESGGARILFDGGLVGDMDVTHTFVTDTLGAEFGYLGAEPAALQSALAALGVGPEDIDVAVVSHIHHDHAGALQWLPRAEVWVHAAELEILQSPYARVVAPDWQITPGTRHTLDDLASSGRLVAWDGQSVSLSDSVELVRVGGHTRGSVALLGTVRSNWRVALLGDLVLSEAHIQHGIVPTTALDSYRTIRSIAQLLETANELWPGHAAKGPVLATAAADSWPSADEWRTNE